MRRLRGILLAAALAGAGVAGLAGAALVRPADATPGPLVQQCARCGDGDSWKDRAGREYRMGLVNAPETDECYGATATRSRRELLARGFRADAYARDRYGRSVSVIYTSDGRVLNRVMAQQGLVDDRYLRTYRHENPALARQLDADFAAAKKAHRGLWGACR